MTYSELSTQFENTGLKKIEGIDSEQAEPGENSGHVPFGGTAGVGDGGHSTNEPLANELGIAQPNECSFLAEASGSPESLQPPVVLKENLPNAEGTAPKSKKKGGKSKDQIDRDMVFWTRAVGVFTALLVVSSGLQYCAMKGQQNVMQGQLAAAKEQADITEAQIRADVRVGGTTANALTVNNVIQGWNINPSVKNTGATDAKNFLQDWVLDVTVGTPCPAFDGKRSQQQPSTIGAGEASTFLAVFLPATLAKAAEVGAVNVFALGQYQYTDVFSNNTIHKEDWCVQVLPNDLSKNLFSFVNVRDRSN